VAPVADIVAVHAPGRGFTDPLAVLAFHLLRLVKVFEISTADQTAGWGRGHVGVWDRGKIRVRIGL
jgi:hypothetical protein